MKYKELISMDFSDFMKGLFELSEPFIPFVHQAYRAINQKNINKKLMTHEKKIKEILISANNSAAREFFFMKLTPIVFEKMINEHEDDKIDFILNGYENCIRNEITDLDKILFYFDIISNLRVLELKRFISHANIINVPLVTPEENSEEAMILKSIDEKLHREGFIGFPEFMGQADFSEPAQLSKKGNFLLKFINE